MSSKQLGTRIKKWLEEEGLSVTLSTQKGFEFYIVVSDAYGIGMNFVVFQYENKNAVILSTTLKLPNEVTGIVKKLDAESKVNLTQSMHRNLLSMVQDHQIKEDLKGITLAERIFVENFTRQRFFESLIRVRNTTLYLISVLKGHFAKSEIPQPSTSNLDMYK